MSYWKAIASWKGEAFLSDFASFFVTSSSKNAKIETDWNEKEFSVDNKEKQFSLSWFFRWFLDNKAITVFLVTLLLGLNL